MILSIEENAFEKIGCKTSAILFWPNVLSSLPTLELPHNGKDPICIHGIASNESGDPKRQTIVFANSGQNPCIKRWHNVKTELSQQHGNMDLVECNSNETGSRLNIKIVFTGMVIPKLKIKWSWDRLIYNMGIPILLRRHLYIATTPWLLVNNESKDAMYMLVYARFSHSVQFCVHNTTRIGLINVIYVRHCSRLCHKYCLWRKTNTTLSGPWSRRFHFDFAYRYHIG